MRDFAISQARQSPREIRGGCPRGEGETTDEAERAKGLRPKQFYEALYAGRAVLLLCPEGTTTLLAQRVGGCRVAHPEDPQAIRAAFLDLYGSWAEARLLPTPNREALRFYNRTYQGARFLGFLQKLNPAR